MADTEEHSEISVREGKAVRGGQRQMIPGVTEETVDETDTGKDGEKEGWA